MGLIVTGHHHHSMVPLSKRWTMPGLFTPPMPERLVEVMEQGVDEGASGMTWSGVDHHPGRLEHHREVGVAIEEFSGRSSGCGSPARARACWGGSHPPASASGRLDRQPVDPHCALTHQAAEAKRECSGKSLTRR